MRTTRSVRKVAVNFNGISIAYLMGFANAAMATVAAFGLNLNDTQRAAVSGLVNASLILAVHLSHRLGETQAAGGQGTLSRAEVGRITADATPQAATAQATDAGTA